MSDTMPFEKPGETEQSLQAHISPTEEIIEAARAGACSFWSTTRTARTRAIW